jgi:hypothetical protein
MDLDDWSDIALPEEFMKKLLSYLHNLEYFWEDKNVTFNYFNT